MDGTISESGSVDSRFKVASPPAVNSPLGSAKMNHVAANSSTLSASTAAPATTTNALNGDKVTGSAEIGGTGSSIKVEDDSATEESEDKLPMEPREAIVRSVPSIELPDGKAVTSFGIWDLLAKR